MQAHPDAARYRTDIVSAFQFGLFIFILTALIGLANALQIFGTLDRNTLLTHLHSGTLGWITMGVIALTLWIFGGAGAPQPGDGAMRRNVLLSAAATVLYVLAFWSGNFYARAIFGVIELAVIIGWWWFAGSRAMAIGFGKLDLPRLSLVLALTTLVIGSSLGVVAQILYATGAMTPALGGSIIGGHASAQVGGYLVLIAIAVGEWRLHKSGGARSASGVAQIYLLFLAGMCLAVGSLLNVLPLQILSSPLQAIAIIIYLVRVGGAALRSPWGAGTGARHFAISVPFLALGLALNIYLVSLLAQAQGDFSKIPAGMIHALDHTMFIGVLTNVLFGSIREQSQARPHLWPWADHVIFWGLNLGAAGFIATLLFVGSGSDPVKFTAPVMGLSALLGIVTYTMRLQSGPAPAPRT